jgi:hypothetical protein
MAISTSEKVKLLKQAAARLAEEEWSLVDLTLKQFGLPSSDMWSGSKLDYVVHMIGDATEQQVIELAEHVGLTTTAPTVPRVDPPFWRAGMFRVFLTHLATHRKFAADLQAALLEFGISTFVAHNDIAPTLEWQGEIETALATCDGLVALLHPDFHASPWTDQEIGFAMGKGVPTFAVRLGHDPYGFIGRFQAFEGQGKEPATLARELFDAYRKRKETQRRMADVLVGLFEASISFAEAKAKMKFLEELEVWDPAYSVRVKSAVRNNEQVSYSWGVPERVEKLIAKWK